MIDFNDAELQKGYELIPEGTIVRVKISLQRTVEGFLIHTSKNDDDTKFLRCVCTVLCSAHLNKKIYDNIGIEGSEKFVSVGKSKIRAILESAKGLAQEDVSKRAIEARRIDSYEDLDGLAVQIKVGIEKSQSDHYADKNKIAKVLTLSDAEYIPLGEVGQCN